MSTPPLWYDGWHEWLHGHWAQHRSLYHPEADARSSAALRSELIAECGPCDDRLPPRVYETYEVESGDGPEAMPDLLPWWVIAEEMSLSVERVRQIAERGMRKLRHPSHRLGEHMYGDLPSARSEGFASPADVDAAIRRALEAA